jgi:hypothetical protein
MTPTKKEAAGLEQARNPGNLDDIRICAEEIVECSGLTRGQFELEGPAVLMARLDTVSTLAKDILQTLAAHQERHAEAHANDR